MDLLLSALNPPQREAVTWPGGPVLVLAGPGSGKTRVIAHRMAWLVAGGVPPWRILAITFTNKAAEEMRSRAAALVEGARELWVGTFHSCCARILRREIGRLGYPEQFTIYDTKDRDELLRQLLVEREFHLRDVTPSAVGRRISWLKNRRQSPDGHSAGESLLEQAVAQVWGPYEERMRRAGALDFDDLLLKALALFEEHPEAAERWGGRFLHVLVDEYQDTNRIQYQLACCFARAHGNLMAVGDPDQSIYAFRGSDLRNILQFEQDHPAARLVRLEQNYRSTGSILEAAGGLIAHNQRRKPQQIWTENGRGEPVLLRSALTAEEEAALVVETVRDWLREGIPAAEIAVFYRVNARSRLLERAFQVEGLGFKVVGALSFYQRREVKDLMAWLRLLVNPADEVSFARAVNAPPRGLGPKGLEGLLGLARREGITPVAALARAREVPRLAGRARESLSEMAALLEELAPAAKQPAAPLARRALERIGYLEWLARSAEPAEARERAANLQELVSAAAECDQRDPEGGLEGFLERVALVSDQDGLGAEGVVQLMTLHTAKGLEFDAVAIVGLEQGTLPHLFSLDTEEGIEEERRLLYVGITRARKRLLLAWAGSMMAGGQWQTCQPSAFLEELPAGCLAAEEAEREPEPEEQDEPVFGTEGTGGLGPGARIRHQDFGVGTVATVRGWGGNQRLVVDFEGLGRKVISVAYSRLELL